jgi:hypothetical protein
MRLGEPLDPKVNYWFTRRDTPSHSPEAWRTYCAIAPCRSRRSAKRRILAHNELVFANTLGSFDDLARLVDGGLNHGLAWALKARMC